MDEGSIFYLHTGIPNVPEHIRFGSKADTVCPTRSALPYMDTHPTSAGNGAASSQRARLLISPIVLSLIMATCNVAKAPISQGKELSILTRRN
jgi:hypothetical protein